MGKKIAYFTVGEDLSADLLRRQVLELVCDIKSSNDDLKITLFSFYNVLSVINHWRDLVVTRRYLACFGVGFVVLPILFPWPIPNIRFVRTKNGFRMNMTWGRVAGKLFNWCMLPVMLFLRLVFGYRIFHCRSYPATGLAIHLKKFVKNTFVIFDPRSDYPEENITAGRWVLNSDDFLYWKCQEKVFLKNSDVVACIGPTYVDHYKCNFPDFTYILVPNNVRVRDFARRDSDRKSVRHEIGATDDDCVYVYLGGISSDGWHRPDFYVSFYEKLSSEKKRFVFLFLVPSHSVELVKIAFSGCDRVFVFSPRDNVQYFLSGADFGMMFFHVRKIAVGTKVGEYMAASLPIVVNPNCLGALELIHQNKQLGFEVKLGLGDLDDVLISDSLEGMGCANLISDAAELPRFAAGYFDNRIIADKYAYIYRNEKVLS